MKNYMIALRIYLFLVLVAAMAAEVSAQRSGIEVLDRSGSLISDNRPFDFTDKYYENNGVVASLMADRRNGRDSWSVFDDTTRSECRQVRITATMPAFDPKGKLVFWNPYAEFGKEAFTSDRSGNEAYIVAHRYPIYMFPSETVERSMRQAPLIETDDAYPEKNPLGLGVVIHVDFTPEIYTDHGRQMMSELFRRNGSSLDGTPLIKTVDEINLLYRMRMIRLGQTGGRERPEDVYVAARILTDPTRGAITPDAFLLYVQTPGGDPLAAEAEFLKLFVCLQERGRACNE